MKPVNDNLHDRFYEESVEGFDAVMKRLMGVLGNPGYVSHAMALDVSENTVKTWRRRGAIPVKYLQGFATKHGVGIDYLLRGEESITEEPAPISNDERLLLDRYRASPRELRDAALRVLLGGEARQAKKQSVKQKISGKAGHQVVGINTGEVNGTGRSGGGKR